MNPLHVNIAFLLKITFSKTWIVKRVVVAFLCIAYYQAKWRADRFSSVFSLCYTLFYWGMWRNSVLTQICIWKGRGILTAFSEHCECSSLILHSNSANDHFLKVIWQWTLKPHQWILHPCNMKIQQTPGHLKSVFHSCITLDIRHWSFGN